MSDTLSTALQQALPIARSATIEQHIIGNKYLFKTGIPDFYIIARLDADEQELAEAVLCQAAIARTVAKSVVGGIQ